MGTTGMWRPHGEQHGGPTGIVERPHRDNMETTLGKHEDNVDNSILFEDL